MADLSRPRRDGRGQILLIAAFTLAVIFVALALVVNSAIFTENLASRGEVAGSSEALGYQAQVSDGVGEAIAFANVYNTSDLTVSIEASVSDFGGQGGTQQATGGQLVNVSLASPPDMGVRIADNSSGGSTFESNSGWDDWQLASDVDRTRDVVINVTDTSPLAGLLADRFTLEVNESGTPPGSGRSRSATTGPTSRSTSRPRPGRRASVRSRWASRTTAST